MLIYDLVIRVSLREVNKIFLGQYSIVVDDTLVKFCVYMLHDRIRPLGANLRFLFRLKTIFY